MHLKNLKLNNYRNFTESELSLNDGTTVLFGGIGEGKTNIIESIFLLSIGRSYRTTETHEVIAWGRGEAYVRGEAQGTAGDCTVAIQISKGRKRIEFNGENNKRSIDLLGGIRSVIFHSEDIGIVSGPPHLRRRFLDIAISQSSPNYAYHLRDYYKILKQRNSALADFSKSSLDEWDEQLSTIGAWLTQVRAKVAVEIGQTAERILRSLAIEDKSFHITYTPSGHEDGDSFRIKLAKARNHDLERGTTSIGPHRDEIKIFLDGVEARRFSSSGERKTVALALKLAEVEFIRAVTGEKPIVLLDDLFSTLDLKRSRALLGTTGDGSQCIITVTDLNILRDELRSGAKMYEVRSGRIKEA